MWVFLMTCFIIKSVAQNHNIKGVVKDAATNKPIADVVIYDGSSAAGFTDDYGKFNLNIKSKEVFFNLVGYETYRLTVTSASMTVEVLMNEKSTELAEVKVKKRRYRNKGNPAVDFIKEVISHKSQNRPSSSEYLYYKMSEKTRAGLANTPEKIEKHPLIKNFPILKSNIDSNKIGGKLLMQLYVYNQITENQKTPSGLETHSLYEKKMALDDEIFDSEGIKMYFSYLYQPFDIYDNGIMMVTNQFLSPISDSAPLFYMFDLADTVKAESGKYLRVLFTPRNTKDLLFTGDMLVALDSSYAIKNINMTLGKSNNLNWVRSLTVYQSFEKDHTEKYNLQESRIQIEFSILKNRGESLFTERQLEYSDYSTEKPLDKKLDGVVTAGEKKLIDGNAYDKRTFENLDSLTQTKKFKTLTQIINLVGYGYFDAGPKVEIGPIGNFIGGNPVEGFRMRFGGRTKPAFSNKVFLEGYGAYGFKDHKWKYYGAVTYSLTGENKYVFPMKNITLSYKSDMEIPGSDMLFMNDYGFLVNFGRGTRDKWVYYDKLRLNYVQEFQNRMSYNLGFERSEQFPTGSLYYVPENSDQAVNSITLSSFDFQFRYAPKERFYQGKTSRHPVVTKYPVFTLRARNYFKDLWGGEYTFQRIAFNIQKRFFIPSLGFTDTIFETGATLGKNLPFPLLNIMEGNQTYTFQEGSYNMMNFMEFVADRYASVKLEHNFNGAILNKIPLLSYFKLREFLSLKVLYGTLSKGNRPGNGNDVFNFPVDEDGNRTMYYLGSDPYVEGGIGVGNIFKILRLDVVKRFSYLNNTDAPDIGFRMRVDIDF